MAIREVGSGKPYSTIQAALDNLYLIQGSAPFTETQTIRVYNGTYTEIATPHSNLTPTATFRLILEAASGNTPIIDGQNVRSYGIYNNANSYVTINGFTVHHCNSVGIYLNSSPFAIITNNICYSNLSTGIYSTNVFNTVEVAYNNCYLNATNGIGINDAAGSSIIHHNNIYSNTGTGFAITNSAGVKIYNNNVYLNGSYGMSVVSSANAESYLNNSYQNTNVNFYTSACTNSKIYQNNFYEGLNFGCYVSSTSDGTKVYRNKVYGNVGMAITCYNTIGLQVYNNLIYKNRDVGIRFEKITNGECYNNTIYLNDSGIRIQAISVNTLIKNNIVMDFWEYCIYVAADSTSGLVCDYNDWYGVGGSFVGVWAAVYYYTLAQWQAASGQGAHTISANPKFQDVNGEIINSLKIIDLSPCAGNGADLSAIFTDDYDGVTRTIPFSMGCYAKTYLYLPIITSQQLDFYTRTEDQNVVASCNVNGTPTKVYAIVNGKAFLLSFVSGILYSATISARDIGICANKTIEFFAENNYGGDYEIAPSTLTVTAGVISILTITSQVLSNYSPTQNQIITATCNVSGNPDNVVVKMNGKSFVMTFVSGTQYRAIIPAYQIGICTNQIIAFMATNNYSGVDEYAPSNITVSANGNYDLAIIQTAIVSLLTNNVPSLSTILGYEPKIIPKLPAVCLWYDGFSQLQTESISYTITHNWVMKLYVDLTDAKTAQDDIKLLIKSILSAFKSDLNLSQTVLKEIIFTGSVGALLDRNNPVLICNFNISTITEED